MVKLVTHPFDNNKIDNCPLKQWIWVSCCKADCGVSPSEIKKQFVSKLKARIFVMELKVGKCKKT